MKASCHLLRTQPLVPVLWKSFKTQLVLVRNWHFSRVLTKCLFLNFTIIQCNRSNNIYIYSQLAPHGLHFHFQLLCDTICLWVITFHETSSGSSKVSTHVFDWPSLAVGLGNWIVASQNVLPLALCNFSFLLHLIP